MKPIKKKSALITLIVVSLVIVLGAIFAFVPMTFGNTTYKSFAGAIRIGNDFNSGMYAEYDIKDAGEVSEADINKSITDIKTIISEKGYSSTNVYAIDGSKIRVEVSFSNGQDPIRQANTLLQAVGVGKFELRSSSSADDTYIVGSKHISGVTISNYTSYTYVTLEFNDAGKTAYQGLLDASNTIYVVMGGVTQTSFDSSSITQASNSLPLTFSSYQSAVDFAMRVRFGSLPIEMNKDTVIIDTIDSRPNITLPALGFAFVVMLLIAFLIIRYGALGAAAIMVDLVAAIIGTFLLWAIPIIEINSSTMLAVCFGFILLNTTNMVYLEQIRKEYYQGKTIEASLDASFKKTIPHILAPIVASLIITVIMAFVSSGMIQTAAIIIAIAAGASLLTSLLLLPWLASIIFTVSNGSEKIYNFKREEK